LVGKLVQYKLDDWYKKETETLMQQNRLRNHYEKTLVITRSTLVQLLPRVRLMIEKQLESESLLLSIGNDPVNRRRYWEDLKMVSFARAIGCVFCNAVLVPMTYVVMMVLASHTLPENSEGLGRLARTQYLRILEDIIDNHLPNLLEKSTAILNEAVSPVPLNSRLSLPQLESILDHIILLITNGGTSENPLPCYVTSVEIVPERTESSEVREMIEFTADVFSTEDFRRVVNSLMLTGRNYILDEVSALYFNETEAVVSRRADEDNIVASSSSAHNHLASSSSVETNGIVESEVSENINKSCENNGGVTIREVDSNTNHQVQSVHLVKLIPVLNNVIKNAMPLSYPNSLDDLEMDYVNRLVLNQDLESLCYSIYDAIALAPTDSKRA